MTKHNFLRFSHVLTVISLLFLTSCYTIYQPIKSEGSSVRIDNRITEESEAINALIRPYKQQLESDMGTVLANIETELNRQKPESTLGNLVADILRDQAADLTGKRVDFAVQNYGGLRIGQIPAGPVTKGKVFELMPFENYLMVVEVPGSDLMEFTKKMIEYGGWPVSDGIKITGKGQEMMSLEIGGEPVIADKIYAVAMPDYIADGGDNCVYFVGKPRINTGRLIRDVLVKWFEDKGKAGEKIHGQLDGRFIIE